MLCHSFSRSETARDCRRTALCNGEKRVDNPLTGDKRFGGSFSLGIRARLSYRPFLAERNAVLCARFVFDFYNNVVYGV